MLRRETSATTLCRQISTERKMAKPADKVTIKKYANRRLYDTESSSYITLDRLAAMIREGRDFEVVDAKTGEDITHQVLTQIIVDEESRGATMLPVNFLRQLIGLYGGQMQGAVPQYLEAAMEAFQKNSATVAGAFGPNVFTDLAKRNMAMFEEAAQSLTGKKAKTESDGSGDELAKLKAELAALQAKVDKLGK
jgi:polyhydroxyalkanoate synthesis repressor PhaR